MPKKGKKGKGKKGKGKGKKGGWVIVLLAIWSEITIYKSEIFYHVTSLLTLYPHIGHSGLCDKAYNVNEVTKPELTKKACSGRVNC